MPTKKSKKTSNETKSAKRSRAMIVGAAVLALAAMIAAIVMLTTEEDSGVKKYEFTKEGSLTILSPEGESLTTIDCEFADTDYERYLGLMNRPSMEENQGMLFLFPVEETQGFYMKNTLISLDMIFIDAQRRIVTIHENAEVGTLDTYYSTKPAKYVLETVGGFCKRHGVREGCIIAWERDE